MEVVKEEVNSEEAKEARTHMEEADMDGAKEQTKEERKEKEKEDSLESVIIVVRRGTVRGSAPRREKEEKREQARGKAFKDIVISVDNLATARAIAGPQAKAREAKEHTWWSGTKEKKSEMKEERRQDAWRKHAHGEARSLETWEDAGR